MSKFFFIFLFNVLSLSATLHTTNNQSELSDDPRELYIDLIKRVVANTIYQDPGIDQLIYYPNVRKTGGDWPSIAHTMIGTERLNNIHFCLKNIIENQIPGDCIETGVWRGGAVILMRAILKAYNDTTRTVFVADSFEGLPPPNPIKYPADRDLNLYKYSCLAISLDQVQENFKRYGLLDNQVVFLQGWFRDTLPTAPIDQIALLRLDGDLYESTMDALTNLYPKLSIGGYVIIDDYGILACEKAVSDYRVKNNINDPIEQIDGAGIYWQKNITSN